MPTQSNDETDPLTPDDPSRSQATDGGWCLVVMCGRERLPPDYEPGVRDQSPRSARASCERGRRRILPSANEMRDACRCHAWALCGHQARTRSARHREEAQPNFEPNCRTCCPRAFRHSDPALSTVQGSIAVSEEWSGQVWVVCAIAHIGSADIGSRLHIAHELPLSSVAHRQAPRLSSCLTG